MKNKHFSTKTLFAIVIALFFTVPAFAQCVVTITDDTPFIEDFDGGNVFDCWTSEEFNGGHWGTLTGTESTVAAYTFTSGSVDPSARLISPVLDMSSVQAATFSFGYAIMGLYAADELVACYRSSEADEWHTLGSYSVNDWDNFYEVTFDLPDLSSTYQISFLGIGNSGFYIFVDNVEVASVMSCARPISIQASEITSTSALLSWATVGNEESWTIALNDAEITVDQQPYLMEGLRPNTEYSFTVRANCGEGIVSDWATPITFTTLCGVVVVTDDAPYLDDFEASNGFVCWQTEIGAGIDDWVVDPGYLFPNNTAFFIWLGGDALLISTPLDITAVTHPTLAFKHKQLQSEYGVDELSVWYRTAETENWQELDRYPNATNQWEQVVLELPNPSDTYQIAFMGVGNNGEGIYVDDVEVGDSGAVSLIEQSSMTASVSPNPTAGNVKVETNVAEGTVVLYDLFGRKVLSATLCEGHADLDLSTLAKGVYVARIASQDGMTTIKLVKE